MVTEFLICKHFIERNVLASRLQVGVPAASPFLFVGRQEDLAFGVGKNHGSLVAAFGHNVLAGDGSLLPSDQLLPHIWVVGRVVNSCRYVEPPNCSRYIVSVEQNAIARQFDTDLASQAS